jgi:hypothetical protein
VDPLGVLILQWYLVSEDVESYGAFIPLIVVNIIDLTIPSTSTDTGQQIHPHMECDQPTPPTWVVDSLRSHDFLDIELPSKEAIMEVMGSIKNPKDEVMHQSYFTYSEQTRVYMMSCDPRLGAFAGAPSTPPSLDPFPPYYLFQNFPPNYFLPLTSNIYVSYFLHVFMEHTKEIP